MAQPAIDNWLSGLDATCLDRHTLDLNAVYDNPLDNTVPEKVDRTTKEGLVPSNARKSAEKQSPTNNPADHGGEEGETGSEKDDIYPNASSLIALTLALMTAVFMIALDTNIIGTAIPKITTQFDSLNHVGWYGSVYLMTQLALQTTFGRLYTFFNMKWVYIVALGVFEVGSVLCATAPTSSSFIAGRAIAGVGAAGINSGSLTIGGSLVPLNKKPLYISIVSSMYGIAAAAGPLLGGVFTDSPRLTWRFCFWINLPFGGLAILIVCLRYKPSKVQLSKELGFATKVRRLDFSSVTVLISSLVCLLLALQWGGIVYKWSNPRVWGCLVGFAGLISIFAVLQVWRRESATVPVRILTQRSIWVGCIFVCFMNMAIDTHIYYIPFYFQAAKALTAEGSGVHFLAYLLPVFIVAIIAGTFVTKFRKYAPLMGIGAAIMVIGSGLLHTLNPNSTVAQWVCYQIITGIGFGMGFQVPYTAVQVVLSEEDVPSGNALVVFFQALGGALAISIAQNVLSSTLSKKLSSAGLRVNVSAFAGATEISTKVQPQDQGEVRWAYSDALSATLILPMVAGLLAFLCSLRMENRSLAKSR